MTNKIVEDSKKDNLNVKVRRFSDEHRRKISLALIGNKNSPTGENNHMWKGGKKKHGDGYWMVVCKDHRFADRHGYVLEHRLVYERHYDCNLLSWVDIHHIDENRANNNINNLMPLSRGQHKRLHTKKDMSDRKCSKCQRSKTLVGRITGYAQWYYSKITGLLLCHSCRANEHYHLKKVEVVS